MSVLRLFSEDFNYESPQQAILHILLSLPSLDPNMYFFHFLCFKHPQNLTFGLHKTLMKVLILYILICKFSDRKRKDNIPNIIVERITEINLLVFSL